MDYNRKNNNIKCEIWGRSIGHWRLPKLLDFISIVPFRVTSLSHLRYKFLLADPASSLRSASCQPTALATLDSVRINDHAANATRII